MHQLLGANRSLDSVVNAELKFPPVKYGRTFTVDHDAGCVTVKGFTDAPAATACYRSHRLGCHLMPRDIDSDSPNTMYKLPHMTAEEDTQAQSEKEWPLGDVPVVSRQTAAAARVDLPALQRAVDAHFEDTRLHARAFLLLVDGQIVIEKYENM